MSTNIAPVGYDRGSTVIITEFPSNFTINDCRNFLSWFGPVIYIEKVISNESCCFVVVFASNTHAETLIKLKTLTIDSSNHTIQLQSPDELSSVWNTVGNIITSATTAPILQMAQDGINVALSGLGLNLSNYLGY